MATFSQLPNEMISEIWEYVWEPQDVESFALVSKHIYAIGASFVDMHNKLKSRFSTGRHVGAYVGDSAMLLQKILLWPRVALYVSHLSIDQLSVKWDEPLIHNDDSDDENYGISSSFHIPYSDDNMELFIETIRRASSVPRNEVEDWITAVKKGNEHPIVALILLLLPNLCTMTLEIHSDFFSCQLAETFQRISETKNSAFLRRLTTVNLDVHLPSENSKMDWIWLNMSATLPSVQSIHVERLGSINIEDLVKSRRCFEPGSSTIQELALAKSSICPKSMFQLFESITGLKKFTYSNPDESEELFEPFWMGKALVTYAKYSLESLQITAERKGVGTLGSFRGCTNLRELETNVHLLLEEGRFHTLADLLPVSIEKVHLYISDHIWCDKVLLIIEVFENAKPQLLPNMRLLTLSLEPQARLSQKDKELIKTSGKNCRDLGIELSIIKRGEK